MKWTADCFGIRRPLDALADVRVAIDSWPTFAGQAGLDPQTIADIHADFEAI